MIDIVDKLQRLSGYLAASGEEEGFPVCDEAADEIERLRRLIRGAHEALCYGTLNAISQARASLGREVRP